MTIKHHPPEDFMLLLAAGRMRPAMALVLQVHLAVCPACRARLDRLESVGGLLLDDCDPIAMAPDALARTLERVDQRTGPARTVARSAPLPMPPGAIWPAALERSDVSRWRWLAPGMRWARAVLPDDPDAPLFLLRIAAGRSLARHTHRRIELTQVLCGSFDDGRAIFGPGDFDLADGDVLHQPDVLSTGECVCLAYVEDGLRYESRLAGVVGRWIGL